MPFKLSPLPSLFALLCLAGCTVLVGCSASGTTSGSTSGSGGTAPSTTPAVTLSPAALTFAAAAANTTSAPVTLTVTNTGGATLTVTGATIAGSNAANFAETSNCTTVAAGATCAVAVTFTPAAASTAYSAVLVLTDNAGGLAGSTQTVALTATSAAPVLVPQAVLAPSVLSFTAPLMTAAAAQMVTLSNPGTGTLTGIAITLSGSASFSEAATTCGTTLAAGANCTISVSFTPSAAGTVTGTLSVADNATGAPQTVALSGIGALPAVTLSAASITFPATVQGTTSAAQSVTVSNSGAAQLTFSSILLGGTNAANFAETTTCGLTLAPGASCTISATFSPSSAASYAAAITLTDSAPNSPQTITLSGSAGSGTSYTLLAVPEADNSVTPLYALINAAQKTVDMTMYALEDSTFTGDLLTACKRGVTVRVILDQNLEKSGNTSAYNQLNAQAGCSAVWANKTFQASHQKSFIIDSTQVAIMSLNLQTQYYSTTRDFALIENNAADIAAIQATFNADYVAGTPVSGVAGTSDFSYAPGGGNNNDLIWSPTTAQAAMLGLINNAQSTLLVENEEMGAANIVSAFEAACQRGVSVRIAMVNQSSYTSNFTALKAAGCKVSLYADTSTGFYIHAKAVVADYGLSTQSVYMGSINYSLASMNSNRELGIYITDPASVTAINTTMTADFNGATPY